MESKHKLYDRIIQRPGKEGCTHYLIATGKQKRQPPNYDYYAQFKCKRCRAVIWYPTDMTNSFTEAYKKILFAERGEQ